MKESFVFYKEYAESIECFKNKKTKGKLFKALCNYALYKKEPNNLEDAEKAVFILLKFIIDKYSILENKDIRTSPAYNQWRKKVLERDNNTCQLCGSTSNLHVHHIKQFAQDKSERFYLDNGITLCANCHKEIHSKKAGELCNN